MVGWREQTTEICSKGGIKRGGKVRRGRGNHCHALDGKEGVQEAESNEMVNRICDSCADEMVAALLGRKDLSQEQIEALKRIVGELE